VDKEPGGYSNSFAANARSNSSWDWNCDGKVETSPTTFVPDCSGAPVGGCTTKGNQAPLGPADCGNTESTGTCAPDPVDPTQCDWTQKSTIVVKCR
jgi:hypothetical protein